MGQNWIVMNGAKVMNEISDFITKNNMVIIYRRHDGEDDLGDDGGAGMTESHLPDPGMYPWVAYLAPRSCACGAGACACPRRFVPVHALHLLTWDRLKGSSDPRKKGQVVHHRNENKHDARLKNLGKGTRSAHRRAHNSRRRRFSPKEKSDFGGFRFLPHQPARVISRPEMIGMVVEGKTRVPPPASKAMRVKAMVDRLSPRWEPLSAEMACLDSGRPIPKGAPRAAWNAPRTRMLGLRMPRMDLSAGEAVFVLLYIKNRYDMDAVAAEACEPRELLAELKKVPAVDVALRRWRSEQRLPLAR